MRVTVVEQRLEPFAAGTRVGRARAGHLVDMIRNVVVGVVREGVPPEQVEEALQALRDLRVAGLELHLVAGQDRGLREGNASYALTVDLPDDEAYRIYDADEEHNRIRRELFAPISTEIRRIQFALPG